MKSKKASPKQHYIIIDTANGTEPAFATGLVNLKEVLEEYAEEAGYSAEDMEDNIQVFPIGDQLHFRANSGPIVIDFL